MPLFPDHVELSPLQPETSITFDVVRVGWRFYVWHLRVGTHYALGYGSRSQTRRAVARFLEFLVAHDAKEAHAQRASPS